MHLSLYNKCTCALEIVSSALEIISSALEIISSALEIVSSALENMLMLHPRSQRFVPYSADWPSYVVYPLASLRMMQEMYGINNSRRTINTSQVVVILTR